MRSPVAAWAAIQEDPEKRADYTKMRGHGGLVRAEWDEVNEIIAAANAYTAKEWGRTGLSDSRLFQPCQWFPMQLDRVTCL